MFLQSSQKASTLVSNLSASIDLDNMETQFQMINIGRFFYFLGFLVHEDNQIIFLDFYLISLNEIESADLITFKKWWSL